MLNRNNYQNCKKYSKDELFRICKIYKLKTSLSFTKKQLCELISSYFLNKTGELSYIDSVYDNDLISLKTFRQQLVTLSLEEQQKILFLSIELGYKDILLFFIKDMSFNTTNIQLSHLINSVKSGNYEIISILQSLLQPKLLLLEKIIEDLLLLNDIKIDNDMYINSYKSSELLSVFAEYYKQLQFDF